MQHDLYRVDFDFDLFTPRQDKELGMPRKKNVEVVETDQSVLFAVQNHSTGIEGLIDKPIEIVLISLVLTSHFLPAAASEGQERNS